MSNPRREEDHASERARESKTQAPEGAAMILAMRLPEVIPIKHEPGYRTDLIGQHAGGQFFADITGAYQEGTVIGGDWREQQRIYAVLHRFDDDGHHVGSDIWFAGVRADGDAVPRAQRRMSEWLSDLGPVTYGDIAIRPFQVDFDDVLFGLVDESDDDPVNGHGGPWAELYPQRLGFHAPWNGEYDT